MEWVCFEVTVGVCGTWRVGWKSSVVRWVYRYIGFFGQRFGSLEVVCANRIPTGRIRVGVSHERCLRNIPPRHSMRFALFSIATFLVA